MTAALIRDRIAAKIANLPSAKHVYSNASSAVAGVAPWPTETLDDGPHALVTRGASTRTGGTGTQRLGRGVDVEWRFSALSPDEANRLMDQIEDEIVTEFSSGITLGGAAFDCEYTGSDRPFDFTDDDDREWIVWVTHFRALELVRTEMTA